MNKDGEHTYIRKPNILHDSILNLQFYSLKKLKIIFQGNANTNFINNEGSSC